VAPPLSFSADLPTMRVDHPEEFVTGEAVAEIAAAAEEAGFDACHVTDHPAGDKLWLDTGGHHALDPFVALSFAAAATERLRLLTYIYVAAYRNPFLSAKSGQSLDVLSGGRLILGVAAGYLRPEYGALGVEFDERNELLEEAIEVMKLAWTEDVVTYEGRHFKARGVSMLPHPVQQPHPPIWMGGNSYRAIRRAVESCQGWCPFPSAGIARAAKTAEIASTEDMLVRLDYARRHADEVGRKEPFDVVWGGGPSDDPAAAREHLRRLADEGITWVTTGFPADDRKTYVERLRRYGDEVISPLR